MLELLVNAEVFAPEPQGRMNLLVAAGKVVWMGRETPTLPASLGAHIRDLSRRRLVPGFIDGHVHVTGGGGEAGPSTRVPPLVLSRLTRGGTTTVVGLLGTDDLTRSTASLIAQVRGLVEEGISAYALTGGYHLPPATLTGSVRGDIVHIDRIIGVGEVALSDHRSSQPTLDELLRLGADAHVAGLMTGKAGIAHLHLGDGARGLDLVRSALDRSEIPARVWNPTHVNRRRALFEAALELADRGCTIDVTAGSLGREGDQAWSAAEALARYLETGLPRERLTVSSDGGGCLPSFDPDGRVERMEIGGPEALSETLRMLLRAGRNLEAVLPAFTSNPARILRLPAKGRIAVGSDADLVALDDEGMVTDVMARGRWHVHDGRLVIRGTLESKESKDDFPSVSKGVKGAGDGSMAEVGGR
jgi:beta-aspartyl-dipeptidase (metallo-type)